MEVTPLSITKEEFLRIQKKTIGYGTEGKVFKVNRKELIKIYHENIANIIASQDVEQCDNITKIYQKGTGNNRRAEALIAYFYNRENDEYLKLAPKHAIKYAIDRQKKVTRTKLPKNIVYVEKIFAGCLLDRIHGIQIHKLTTLPLNIRKKIVLEVLRSVRELIENYIYHVDLDNSPFSSTELIHEDGSSELVGHSHILIDQYLHPHIIDLDGKSTIYTERRNEYYESLSILSLNTLIMEYLLKIDNEVLKDLENEREMLAYQLESIGVKDQHIEKLINLELGLDDLETFTKTLTIRK